MGWGLSGPDEVEKSESMETNTLLFFHCHFIVFVDNKEKRK